LELQKALFIIALIVAVVSFAVVVSTYLLYFILVLQNSKTKYYVQLIKQILTEAVADDHLPNVTVMVPMFNEEVVISKKLQNMAKLDYPIEKMEILLVDDCSTDRTCEVAERTLKELGLNGKIVKNPQRMGANASYNIGASNASSNLILRTDADIILSADSLRKAVQIIINIENIGAVTGMMNPFFDTTTVATTMEKEYRSLFDQMSIAESALHSTFPGGGGFTLMKRSVFSPISVNLGSTDGNISLSIVKKGYRHIYVPESFSFEIVSEQIGDQIRQKVRRARRVIQSTIMNRDIIFNRKYQQFGMLIFPLRFSMFVISPFLIFTGISSMFYLLLSYSLILSVSIAITGFVLLLLGTKTKIGFLNIAASVFAQQLYLVLGLFLLPKKNSTWKKVERLKQPLH
jgi:biofilm PGA synthesis N-glycosyltransferase PgaC